MSASLARAVARGGPLDVPGLLRKARAALAEAETLPDLARLVDQAEVVRVAARKAALSQEQQNLWAEYALDAQRKAGALLRRLAQAGGRAQRSSNKRSDDRPPTLVELGIADDQATANTRATRWQQLAGIPEPAYEAFKAKVHADPDGVLTQSAALALARSLRPATTHAAAHARRLAELQAAVDAGLADAPTSTWWPRYGRIEQAESLDFLRRLKRAHIRVHQAITSPAFWMLRDYGTGSPRELGLEPRPADYVTHLCAIVDAIGEVLAPGGTLLLNLGDTYANQPGGYRGDPERARGISAQGARANGSAPAGRILDVPTKSLCLIPERVVLELALHRGWRVAARIVWVQVGHAGENVHDRPAQGCELLYVLTRSQHCFWHKRTGEPGDPEDDWWPIRVGRRGAAGGHLAPFPDELVERAIRHGCPERGRVLDPFAGSGTVRDVAHRMGRQFVGCDLLGEPGEPGEPGGGPPEDPEDPE